MNKYKLLFECSRSLTSDQGGNKDAMPGRIADFAEAGIVLRISAAPIFALPGICYSSAPCNETGLFSRERS